MPQLNNVFQIVVMSGVTGSAWTPVVCPIPRGQYCIIRNRDSAVDLQISTDTAGSSWDVIPKNTEREIKLEHNSRGFAENEIVCYLKGAVTTQPAVWWFD